jgi:glycerol-3-phosphate acyltransferase PlsY
MTLSPVTIVAMLGAAYMFGSIPFSLLLGWLKGVDLRQVGSGNPGATNVARALGWGYGLLALLLDAGKGLAPTALLPMLASAGPEAEHVAVGCGAAAILGHTFPCWLRFRGGKGVATSLGVVGWLAPVGALAAVGTFAVCFAATRIVSLGSLVAAATFAAVQLWQLWPFSSERWSLIALSILAPVLVAVRHRANIVRLLRGEETRLTAKPPAQ